MGVREQLRDPWGIVTAALLGGLGGAVTAALAPAAIVAVPVGMAIAGVVYGVKVALGATTDRALDVAAAPGLPAPPRGSPAHQWLRRAEAAVATLRDQTMSAAQPELRSQIADVDDRAAATLADLRRVGGHATLIEQAAARIPAAQLRAERDAIKESAADLPDGSLRAERERALRAVNDQLKIRRRLVAGRDELLARMHSTVLGLEGLVAQLAELLALHATSDAVTGTGPRVRDLTDELEALRTGLAESEETSRRILDRAS